jgi:hypothetical protein
MTANCGHFRVQQVATANSPCASSTCWTRSSSHCGHISLNQSEFQLALGQLVWKGHEPQRFRTPRNFWVSQLVTICLICQTHPIQVQQVATAHSWCASSTCWTRSSSHCRHISLNQSEFQLAVWQLVRLGFFFAMRSRVFEGAKSRRGANKDIITTKFKIHTRWKGHEPRRFRFRIRYSRLSSNHV